MELIYSYIKKFRSFIEQEICYSNKFSVCYSKENKTINIKKNNLFNIYPNNIINVNAIVGKNGSGKSNLCDYIGANFGASEGYVSEDKSCFFNLFYLQKIDMFYVESNSADLFSNSIDKTIINTDLEYNSFIGTLKNESLVFDHIYKQQEKNLVAIFLYRQSYSPIYFGNKKKKQSLNERIVSRQVLSRNDTPLSERIKFLFEMVHRKDRQLYCAEKYMIIIKLVKEKYYDFEIPSEIRISDQLQERIFDKFLVSLFYRYCTENKRNAKEIRVIKDKLLACLKDSDNDIAYNNFISKIDDKYDRKRINLFRKFSDKINKTQSQNQIVFCINQDTTEKEINEIRDIVNIIKSNKVNAAFEGFFGKYYIDYLTDGERANLELFSTFSACIRSNSDINNYVIILDEPETSMHPEFCRNFLSNLINFLSAFDKKSFQLIISTHSPFILSDIPKSNVVLLENKECLSCVKPESFNTFGQNINALLHNDFFMTYTLGEFARQKILQTTQWLLSSDEFDDKEATYFQNIIHTIGDEILRKEFVNLYNKKCPKNLIFEE